MSALPHPEIEGKYEVLEKIKEGGMGAIYKVRHRLLGEVRVIKVIRPHLEDDEELRARFLREAKVAIQLRHPNVAQIYDFAMDDSGTAYMVMEFIDGQTLQALLQRVGSLPIAITLEIARQTLRALGYLHQQGFVHRDVSPDNLMLTRDVDGHPLVKMIDLGIAKGVQAEAEASLTATGMFLGKLRYGAPEQLQASGPLDGRADLYSFGVVLYETLTGHYPIPGDSPPSIIAGHLFSEPMDFAASDPEGRLPEALRQIVLRCLAKTPEERFASAQELMAHLEAVERQIAPDRGDFEKFLRFLEGETEATLPKSSFGTTARRLEAQFPPVPTPRPTAPPRSVPQPLAQPLTPPAQPVPWFRRPLVWVGLAFSAFTLLLLAVVVGLLWWQRPGKIDPEPPPPQQQQAAVEPPPSSPPPPAPPPPAVPVVRDGTLMLNALPWGEVRAIVNADGQAQPLPSSPYTPLLLTLPAGTYTLTLRHPDRVASLEVEVEVEADRAQRSVVRLADPDFERLEEGDLPMPMRLAVTAYLNGDYARVLRTLDPRALPPGPRAAGAFLLRAAARHALYQEGGGRDEALLAAAREDARNARRRRPNMPVPPAVFSPRFVEFYRGV